MHQVPLYVLCSPASSQRLSIKCCPGLVNANSNHSRCLQNLIADSLYYRNCEKSIKRNQHKVRPTLIRQPQFSSLCLRRNWNRAAHCQELLCTAIRAQRLCPLRSSCSCCSSARLSLELLFRLHGKQPSHVSLQIQLLRKRVIQNVFGSANDPSCQCAQCTETSLCLEGTSVVESLISVWRTAFGESALEDVNLVNLC